MLVYMITTTVGRTVLPSALFNKEAPAALADDKIVRPTVVSRVLEHSMLI